jgi:ABC-type glycerol-3-phosphate transport system permease component
MPAQSTAAILPLIVFCIVLKKYTIMQISAGAVK